MGLFGFNKKKEECNFSIDMFLMDDISNFKTGKITRVSLDDELECIIIKQKQCKDSFIETKIKYDQVTNALNTTDSKIQEQSKSVAGRAVLGGVVLGPIGAIVGGASGIGNKTKKVVTHLVVINYKSNIDGEIKALKFQPRDFIKQYKLVDKIKERIKKENVVEFL